MHLTAETNITKQTQNCEESCWNDVPSSSVSGENGLQGMTPDGERQKRKEKKTAWFPFLWKENTRGKSLGKTLILKIKSMLRFKSDRMILD